MDALTLTFRRRGATLMLRRERTPEGVALVALESGRPRTFVFSHVSQLVRFQRDLEDFLRRTGWTLADAPTADAPADAAPAAVDDADALRLTLAEEEVGARR